MGSVPKEVLDFPWSARKMRSSRPWGRYRTTLPSGESVGVLGVAYHEESTRGGHGHIRRPRIVAQVG